VNHHNSRAGPTHPIARSCHYVRSWARGSTPSTSDAPRRRSGLKPPQTRACPPRPVIGGPWTTAGDFAQSDKLSTSLALTANGLQLRLYAHQRKKNREALESLPRRRLPAGKETFRTPPEKYDVVREDNSPVAPPIWGRASTTSEKITAGVSRSHRGPMIRGNLAFPLLRESVATNAIQTGTGR